MIVMSRKFTEFTLLDSNRWTVSKTGGPPEGPVTEKLMDRIVLEHLNSAYLAGVNWIDPPGVYHPNPLLQAADAAAEDLGGKIIDRGEILELPEGADA